MQKNSLLTFLEFADTIVMIRYGDISKTTSIQKNTLNPAWDATFTGTSLPIFLLILLTSFL